MITIKNSLGQSHDILEMIVKEGDTVIDATAGNGNDSVFLARLVGDTGRVYAFDIQAQAIENTRKKLEIQGLIDRVTLINDGHENLDKYISGRIRAAVFNLGYLPGGDHRIGTKGDSTSQAVDKALKLLAINGVIAIVVYYGGDSGFDEKEFVMEYIKGIDHKKFTVMKTEFVNQPNCPPILVCIEKYAE